MTKKRSYRTGDLAALQALCRGSCYEPTCGDPVVQFNDGVPHFNLQIAHIHALSPGGPRYDPAMTDEERNSFANLILLCKVHHDEVDKLRPADYPPDRLLQWKASREASGQEALSGLRELTTSKLQELITEAYRERDRAVGEAIERLEHRDYRSAELLRSLAHEIEHLRAANSDSFRMGLHAAQRLEGVAEALGHLPTSAGQLGRSAEQLLTFTDAINRLAWSATQLKDLPALVGQLSEVARKLEEIQNRNRGQQY